MSDVPMSDDVREMTEERDRLKADVLSHIKGLLGVDIDDIEILGDFDSAIDHIETMEITDSPTFARMTEIVANTNFFDNPEITEELLAAFRDITSLLVIGEIANAKLSEMNEEFFLNKFSKFGMMLFLVGKIWDTYNAS